MGTSKSRPGPSGGSPLVPPWADDQPEQPLPSPMPMRFKPFRQSLGKFIASGDRSDLKNAIGHYARKASGGGSTAARRMGSVTKTGGNLFDLLTGGSAKTTPGEATVDLSDLSGLPCDQAISEITQALTPPDGDGDKIRVAMNYALAGALDGVEIFDPSCITDDVIVDTMIVYLAESIFMQIVMDSEKAWNNAETATKALRAESELRELIKVVVDKHMGPKLKTNVRSFTRSQMIQVERSAILEVWKEWESYQ